MFLIKKPEVKKEGKVGKEKKRSMAEIRLQKELVTLREDLGGDVELVFPNADNITEFDVKIKVTEKASYWCNAIYTFHMKVPPNYPHEPPTCKCSPKIYHPNIDFHGNVCLPIMRKDWKPVLGMYIIITGLKMILVDPNADDPLNVEVAEIMRTDLEKFKGNVRRSLQGHSIGEEAFEKLV